VAASGRGPAPATGGSPVAGRGTRGRCVLSPAGGRKLGRGRGDPGAGVAGPPGVADVPELPVVVRRSRSLRRAAIRPSVGRVPAGRGAPDWPAAGAVAPGTALPGPPWKKRDGVLAGAGAGLAAGAGVRPAARLARSRRNSAILLWASLSGAAGAGVGAVAGRPGFGVRAAGSETGGFGAGAGCAGAGLGSAPSWASWSLNSLKLLRPVKIFSSNGSGGCRKSSSSPKMAASSASTCDEDAGDVRCDPVPAAWSPPCTESGLPS